MVRFLNQVRLGQVSKELQTALDKCLVAHKPKPTNGIIPTKLYSINREVNAENEARLAELEGPLETVHAVDRYKVVPTKTVPFSYYSEKLDGLIPSKIDLKIGAQVMLLRNRLDRAPGGSMQSSSLVNGSRGQVVGFSESILAKGMMVPTVQFDNGLVATIGPVEYVYKIPNSDGVIVRFQVPIKLAWAATIHKSQGSTLSCAELMLGNTFDYGQAYVALSRVKDFDGLWLSEPMQSRSVKASPIVLDFYGYSSPSLTYD
jgi:ATP-dependent DNA helicase PIF1